MKDIIIIGAGGHGAEIDEYIAYSQKQSGITKYNVIGFLDDDPGSYTSYQFSGPYMGGIRNHKIRKDCNYIIGIANLKYRKFFVDKFLSEGAKFVSFVHHNAYVSESAKLGQGVIICPNANIGPNVSIGDFSLINSRCSLGHDTKVGKFNFISPNVCFSGFTEIGDENLFGINSATIPGIKIGDKNKIAAGMVLDRNVADDSVVFYRHKERVIAIPKPK
ncbi:MAG: acetyltransferase [Bacteroidales bacterium]|nr:acetyltransferase [Bacteroidales bacterium]